MAVAVTNEIPTKSFVAEQEATNHENLRTTGLNPIGRHKINFELSSYKVISLLCSGCDGRMDGLPAFLALSGTYFQLRRH